MAATFKLFIINSPNGPILILYSDKALMEGEIGANGTLGPKQWQQGQSMKKRGNRKQKDAEEHEAKGVGMKRQHNEQKGKEKT